MKFNVKKWLKKQYKRQYKGYIEITPTTKKERRVLRKWVKSGHSVYANSMGDWEIEFLDEYRYQEYIKENTKDMDQEEATSFIRAYTEEYEKSRKAGYDTHMGRVIHICDVYS